MRWGGRGTGEELEVCVSPVKLSPRAKKSRPGKQSEVVPVVPPTGESAFPAANDGHTTIDIRIPNPKQSPRRIKQQEVPITADVKKSKKKTPYETNLYVVAPPITSPRSKLLDKPTLSTIDLSRDFISHEIVVKTATITTIPSITTVTTIPR